jgi:hypothetical protein
MSLASRVATLRRALRGMLTHTFVVSDKGTAHWYQEGMRALGTEAEDV